MYDYDEEGFSTARRRPFDMDDFIRFISDRDVSKERLDHVIERTMLNPEFAEYLFPVGETTDNGLSEKMYTYLIKKRVLKSICRVIEDNGPRAFTRSIACWIYSVVTVAISVQEKRWDEFKEEFGDLKPRKDLARASDARQAKQSMDEYDAVILYLVKLLRKIVKKDVQRIVYEAEVPQELAECTVLAVPEAKYITPVRVGFYLNNVLLSIYRFVDGRKYDTKNVKWKTYFKTLFGEKNVVEAATFILLEGVPVDEYGPDVDDTLNNLTYFALKELEKAPQQLQTQMIELYTKRLGRMFANRSFDLRANLLDLDNDQFPSLATTIAKHADKIREIIQKVK